MNIKAAIINSIGYKNQQFIKTKLSNFAETITAYQIKDIVEGKKYEQFDATNKPIMIINKGPYEYSVLNVCFISNMIQLILYSINEGYNPYINVKDKNGNNLWELFFEQPYLADIENDYLNVARKDCGVMSAPIYFPAFPDGNSVDKYGPLFSYFVRLIPSVQDYFDLEYEKIIKGRRMLGVLCRGTDYIVMKPKNHPVQPSVKEVIELAAKKMDELKCEGIYLATEEQTIYEMFLDAFPEKVFINQRQWFDGYYDLQKNHPFSFIDAVNFDRIDDNYRKGLEYLSSMNLLSKCTALIGGTCGGGRFALYMNNGKYEYSHLFNKGVY